MPKPNRHSIRLKKYNYSNEGHYFITVCTHDRQCLFGVIENDQMVLNELGKIIKEQWLDVPKRYPNVLLHEFIIMPNHVHGIVEIVGTDGGFVGAIHELPLHVEPLLSILRIQRRQMLLPKIIGYFKMNCAKQINELRKTPGQPVWQRNYYEHIIDTEKALDEIREYIVNNPMNWEMDRNNSTKTLTRFK